MGTAATHLILGLWLGSTMNVAVGAKPLRSYQVEVTFYEHTPDGAPPRVARSGVHTLEGHSAGGGWGTEHPVLVGKTMEYVHAGLRAQVRVRPAGHLKVSVDATLEHTEIIDSGEKRLRAMVRGSRAIDVVPFGQPLKLVVENALDGRHRYAEVRVQPVGRSEPPGQ